MKGDKQRSISLKAYWADKDRSKKQREINVEIARKMGNSWLGKERSKDINWLIKIKRKKVSEKNPMWKGDDVGSPALHNWVRRHKLKPTFCEECNINIPYDLANISQEYHRDVNDFKWLCRRCHMQSDGRSLKVLNNLKQFQ